MTPLLAAALLFSTRASALEVTVYNQNLGLVRESREFDIKNGESELRVVDVAAQIDPTSVHFKSLTAPDDVAVLEQDFQYDLVSQDKLLEKYLGREIELERFVGVGGDKREVIKGVLLSNSGGRVVLSDGKVLVDPPGNPVLPELPEGLLTKPTLVWKLSASKGGKQSCELSYLTNGMDWHADYVAVSSPNDDQMDLNAWVTVDNHSGATYKDAKLKLVAGDVHRAESPQPRPMFAAKAAMAAPVSGFEEKSFFEYHLYTLQRPTTLADDETKQVELASAAGVPMKKTYIYDGAAGLGWSGGPFMDPGFGRVANGKVAVTLEFVNSKKNHLGLALPKGRVRVYKKDTDGALEFVGEDQLDHTPKDEKVRLRLGDAFDIVGERKQTDFQTEKRRSQESFEIKLRNHKDSDAVVTVVEHLYRWNEWEISDASMKWTKKDARTIEFQAAVPKDGETVITYTVKYRW